LFLSDYDYSNCENKENIELIVSKISEISFNGYLFKFVSIEIDISERERYFINKLLLQTYDNEIITLLKSQTYKISNFRISYLRKILLNSVYLANNFQKIHPAAL